MAQAGNNWRQFSLRAIFFLTFTVAVFFAGYRLGFHAGQDALPDFGSLIRLLGNTIPPESWELKPDDPFSTGADPFSTDPADPVTSDAADPFR